MKLNINEFRDRLEKEIAEGRTEEEIADYIHNEVRTVEIMKASLMDEMNESTKEFLNNVTVKIDTYLFQLQEMEKSLRKRTLSLDQRAALNDKDMRAEIAENMEKLHDLDPEKYSEEGTIDPTEDLPEK